MFHPEGWANEIQWDDPRPQTPDLWCEISLISQLGALSPQTFQISFLITGEVLCNFQHITLRVKEILESTRSTMAIAANRASTAIEFIVKPKDDLFLEGTLRTLPRVAKGEIFELPSTNVLYLNEIMYYLIGEPYPCQMQKNQTFSCLFRHYAKHNGLKKEGQSFYESEDNLIAEWKIFFNFSSASFHCYRSCFLFCRWTPPRSNAWNSSSHAPR